MDEQIVTRCKVYVESVRKSQGGYETLELRGIMADEIPENKRFNSASPMIEMKIGVANPQVWGRLQPGDRFYVDFIPAPDCPRRGEKSG